MGLYWKTTKIRTMWVVSPWGFSEVTIQPARHECHASCPLQAEKPGIQPVVGNTHGTHVEQVVSSFQKILKGSQLTWYYPRFNFTPKTGLVFPETGVLTVLSTPNCLPSFILSLHYDKQRCAAAYVRLCPCTACELRALEDFYDDATRSTWVRCVLPKTDLLIQLMIGSLHGTIVERAASAVPKTLRGS